MIRLTNASAPATSFFSGAQGGKDAVLLGDEGTFCDLMEHHEVGDWHKRVPIVPLDPAQKIAASPFLSHEKLVDHSATLVKDYKAKGSLDDVQRFGLPCVLVRPNVCAPSADDDHFVQG